MHLQVFLTEEKRVFSFFPPFSRGASFLQQRMAIEAMFTLIVNFFVT